MGDQGIWRSVIDECRKILFDHLDPDQLATYLRVNNAVITRSEYETVQGKVTSTEKLLYLVEVMVRKDRYWVVLLEYLDQHHQTQVSQKLRESYRRLQEQETRGMVQPNVVGIGAPQNDAGIQTAEQPPNFALITTWQKIRFLGRGAFGQVDLCSLSSGYQFALKQVFRDPANRAHALEVNLFSNEISQLEILQHERIVKFLGSRITDESICIFMEFMAGGSIRDEISISGALTEAVARKYTRQILEGLVYLHSHNTIHRDIKSANILRDLSGNVKIADFGICKRLKTMHSHTLGTRPTGTACYMAPEIINGQEYGPNVDIWSLACTIVEMVTDSPPWGGLPEVTAILRAASQMPTYTLPNGISPAFADFLKFLFVRDRRERPSAEEALHQLIAQGAG